MSKKCINCNNNEVYKDNIAKCPKCGNFLRKVDGESEDSLNNTTNNASTAAEEDPYSNYFDCSTNNNCDETSNSIKENDVFKEKSFFDFDTFKKEENEITDKLDKPNSKKEKSERLTQNKNEPDVEGIVKNFFEQEISTFFITKLFRSLFLGLPFTLGNTVNTFQVYKGWGLNSGDNQTGTEVIVYGKIAKGKLPENNVVKVWGKKDKNGTIIAKKIHNNTSNTYLKINHAISPVVIWMLFLTVIYTIYRLTQVNWGQVFANMLSFIIMIGGMLVFLYFMIVTPIKGIFGKKDK